MNVPNVRIEPFPREGRGFTKRLAPFAAAEHPQPPRAERLASENGGKKASRPTRSAAGGSWTEKTELEMPIYPYPTKTGWDAATASYKPSAGPRGGVERIADRFLPPAAE